VNVQRRAVHRLVACAACPGGVSAAVAKASEVADQHLVGAESVAIGAAGGWLCYPLPVGRSDELALHPTSLFGGATVVADVRLRRTAMVPGLRQPPKEL
jgi:hypothetical protein